MIRNESLGDSRYVEIKAAYEVPVFWTYDRSTSCTSYASPSAKFKDMTSGIDFYKRVAYIEEHFDEEKEALSQRLYALTKKIFRPDNMMISYTAAREGLEGMEPENRRTSRKAQS